MLSFGRLILAMVIVGLCFAALVKAEPAADADAPSSKPIRIAIIGDSTVCDYPPERGLAGWGQVLGAFMDSERVTIINHARGGRSSKSFLTDQRWQQYLQMDPPADYLFIQFGHNDNHGRGKGPSRETLPDAIPATLPAEGLGSALTDYYRHNLATYVAAARARGAIPVLVTPMERYVLNRDGELDRRNRPYAEATLVVGEELGVLAIDLNAYSAACYAKWSQEEASSHHLNQPGRGLDRTHYNVKGARVWAAFIAQQLARNSDELRGYVRLNAD